MGGSLRSLVQVLRRRTDRGGHHRPRYFLGVQGKRWFPEPGPEDISVPGFLMLACDVDDERTIELRRSDTYRFDMFFTP